MDVRLFDDADAFLREAAGYLTADPFSASVIAVSAGRVSAGHRQRGTDDRWITMADGGRVVGLAMHTPPHRPFVARMPQIAAVALADTLADRYQSLPGVNGESHAGAWFAAAWRQRTGEVATVDLRLRMCRLAELRAPTGVPGERRRAEPDDVDLVAGWAEAFHDEAIPQDPPDDWAAWAAWRIEHGELHLWVGGGAPVAMAAHTAPAAGVARIGAVYTPPPLRRRGFGAAATAAATASALDAEASHVVLYTDLSNQTSNSIYQAIGYRPDHDAANRAFARTADAAGGG